MQVLNFVTENRRTNWDIFTVQNAERVGFLLARNITYVSDEMIAIMLGQNDYRMFNYATASGKRAIGYGVGDAEAKAGVTESEAFSQWLDYIKQKERAFKASLPLISISQAHYDALFSLYCDTGSWKRVQSDVGIYDVYSAVKAQRWLLVADMINDGKVNPTARHQEARVLKLADYTNSRTRTFLRNEGIKFTINQYTTGNLTQLQQRQAENAYYRQTTAFIPGISEIRKRELVNTLGKLS